MSDDFIDYGELIDDAMHVIVKKALNRIKDTGLPGKHHFFISFLTDYPGVELADHLRSKYPDEMTIVLQHQFDDLQITDSGFSVVLSFDNMKERVSIPFDSLVAFADPSVKFGLQFRHAEDVDSQSDDFVAEVTDLSSLSEADKSEVSSSDESERKVSKDKKSETADDNNVISLDTFRKK